MGRNSNNTGGHRANIGGLLSLLGGALGGGAMTGGYKPGSNAVDIPANQPDDAGDTSNSPTRVSAKPPQWQNYQVANPGIDRWLNGGQAAAQANQYNQQAGMAQMQQDYARQLAQMNNEAQLKAIGETGNQSRLTGTQGWEQGEASKLGTDVTGLHQSRDLTRPVVVGRSLTDANNQQLSSDVTRNNINAELGFQSSPRFKPAFEQDAASRLYQSTAANSKLMTTPLDANSAAHIGPTSLNGSAQILSGPKSTQTITPTSKPVYNDKGQVIMQIPGEPKVTTGYSEPSVQNIPTPQQVMATLTTLRGGNKPQVGAITPSPSTEQVPQAKPQTQQSIDQTGKPTAKPEGYNDQNSLMNFNSPKWKALIQQLYQSLPEEFVPGRQ